ncbi:MAG: hypothetical protein HN540_01690 [Rhodospirillaceae bacterium]|nr:hypothetical protein [Rhodospirillaceae bacterium]
MCTVVILRRPDHDWPLIIGANRDEMRDRPAKPPARHWDDRDHVVAGMDELAGGTWLALNDDRLVAAVLNRYGSLGPDATKRSRGELPLEAVDHAEAKQAAKALALLEPESYRTFNMVIADTLDAFWVRSDGKRVEALEIPQGLSMITANDLNDTEGSDRIGFHLDRFRRAPAPDPGLGDWDTWKALLASGDAAPGAGPGGAMCVGTDTGFGTVSSSLIGLPSVNRTTLKPQWLYCDGPPDAAVFQSVDFA